MRKSEDKSLLVVFPVGLPKLAVVQGRSSTRPNIGVQATAASVRSCLAPAARRA